MYYKDDIVLIKVRRNKMSKIGPRKFNLQKVQYLIFIVAIIIVGCYARYLLFPLTSVDSDYFLAPWFEYFKENGGFAAVGDDIGDYMPTYYYIVAFLGYLPIKNGVIALKVVSCIADVILAFLVMKIVELNGVKKDRSIIAFAITFILPSVMINSAAWGQCDAIYTSFLVASLYCILKGKDYKAMILFTISFAFKLQAIFFAPFLLLMFLKKKMRWRSIAVVPVVYFLAILPALLAGGSLKRILTVYLKQSSEYGALNLNIPNIWSFLQDVGIQEFGKAGVFLAAGVVFIAIYYLVTKKYELNQKLIICFAYFFTLIMPYLLPHMHDRYYYPAEILCIIFVFCFPKRYWVLLTTQFCAVQALAIFFLYQSSLDLRWLAVVLLINMIAIGYSIKDEMAKKEIETDDEPVKKEIVKLNK